jgi:ketosteroid isomerase-like protein
LKSNIVLVLLLAGISWTVHVFAAEADLIDLERELAAAVLALDFDRLDEIYAEDFLFTHSTGDVDTKATWIEALRSGRSSYTARSVDQITVENHGSVAITSGRIHAKSVSNDPRWHEYSIWYVRVYELQDGQWRLLSHRSIREESGPLSD